MNSHSLIAQFEYNNKIFKIFYYDKEIRYACLSKKKELLKKITNIDKKIIIEVIKSILINPQKSIYINPELIQPEKLEMM